MYIRRARARARARARDRDSVMTRAREGGT